MNKVVSAGGVIIKDSKVLLVRFSHRDGVTFPKGHVEKGESVEEAALREVREETGYVDLSIVRKLGVVTRPSVEKDGTPVIKDIHLFLMKLESDKQIEADEETEWLYRQEAEKSMYKEEIEFVNKYCQNLGWE